MGPHLGAANRLRRATQGLLEAESGSFELRIKELSIRMARMLPSS